MKTVRSLVPAVAVLVLAVSTVLVPQTVFAAGPPSPMIEPQAEDNDCGTFWAGVVNNASSFNMKIRGNLTEGGQPQTLTLGPGQNSERDTVMCDVDDVTVPDDIWYLWYWRDANDWAKIRSWNLHCFDFYRILYGTVVRCLAVWMDPEEPEPTPPIPEP